MIGNTGRGPPQPLFARGYVTPFSLSRHKGAFEYVLSSLLHVRSIYLFFF